MHSLKCVFLPWSHHPPVLASINAWHCLLLGSEVWKFQGKLANVFLAETCVPAGFAHPERVWVLMSHNGEPGTCLQFPVESWFLLVNESSVHVLHMCLVASMEGSQRKNPTVGDPGPIYFRALKKSRKVAKLCKEDEVRMWSWILESDDQTECSTPLKQNPVGCRCCIPFYYRCSEELGANQITEGSSLKEKKNIWHQVAWAWCSFLEALWVYFPEVTASFRLSGTERIRGSPCAHWF